jgi:hypothetical protein
MARQKVIYDSVAEDRESPIRTTLIANEKALKLFSARERNAVLKAGGEAMGYRWIDEWLFKRFTKYMERSPFNYRQGNYYRHFRLLAAAGAMSLRELLGPVFWDPWDFESPIPDRVMQMYWNELRSKKKQHSRSGFNRWISSFRGKLKRELRQRIRTAARRHEKTGNPFVEFGTARATATSRARTKAVAPGGRLRADIRIPFGHPIAPNASRMFKTIPRWEIADLAKALDKVLGFEMNSAQPVQTRTGRNRRQLNQVQRARLGVRPRAGSGVRSRSLEGVRKRASVRPGGTSSIYFNSDAHFRSVKASA